MCGVDRVNGLQLPLYLLMVDDGHRIGRMVAFAFLKNANKEYVQQIFASLQRSSAEVAEKIQVVVTDSELVDPQSVTASLPNVSVQLCSIHILKQFCSGMPKCGSQQKESALQTFKQLVHAETETQFKEIAGEFQTNPMVADYYYGRWDTCKDRWALYCLGSGRMYSRCPAYIKKIRALVNGKLTLTECVRRLLHLFNSQHKELSKSKSTYNFCSLLPSEFVNQLKFSVARMIDQQLRRAVAWWEEGMTINDDGAFIYEENCFEVDEQNCSCGYFMRCHFTCKHIFLYRLQYGLPLYQEQDIAALQMANRSGDDENEADAFQTPVRTQTEKLELAVERLQQLAVELSECDESLFDHYMTCCEHLATHVRAKAPCCISSSSNEADVGSSTSKRAWDVLRWSREDAVEHFALDSTAAHCEIQTDGAATSDTGRYKRFRLGP
jgi:hypothetical protein